MKEKERDQIRKSSEKNLWMATVQDTLISMMKECEHRPTVLYEDPENGNNIVSMDDLKFIKGFLSLMEGYMHDDMETKNIADEFEKVNDLLAENLVMSEEILNEGHMSPEAKELYKDIRDMFNDFSKTYDFTDIRIVGNKTISMKKLDSRDLGYFITVKEYLRGFVFKDLYKLKPESLAHA